MIRIFLLLSLLLFSANAGFAQTINGRVVDAGSGEPLVGSVIVITGTTRSAVTGFDGGFRLDNVASDRPEVLCSYFGYESFRGVIAPGDVAEIRLHPSATRISEVVVTGQANRGSDIGARISERVSDNVVNIISAQSIEISPDLTAANVLQRVSGISLEKSSQGEGRHPIIRGMDKRYNYTLVNGVKIPSPDDKNRYVPMDIFPAELVESIEVYKGLTPELEGDAIGGAMNLRMKNATEEPSLGINVSTGYSAGTMRNDYRGFEGRSLAPRSPAQMHGAKYLATPADFSLDQFKYTDKRALPDVSAGISAGSRFFDGRLGVMFGGSFQNTYRFNRSTYFSPSTTVNVGNEPAFDDLLLRAYSTQIRRTGAHGKIDWRIDDENNISLYLLYLNLFEAQNRSTVDSVMRAKPGPGSGVVRQRERSRTQAQDVWHASLHGDHKISEMFDVDWSFALSKATNDLPGWAEFSTEHSVSGGQMVREPVIIPILTYTWQRNSDTDLNASANVKYSPTKWLTLQAGGLFRTKHRYNYHNSYDLFPESVDGLSQVFTGYDDARFYFSPVESGYGNENNANHYNSDENIAAGYLQFKALAWSKLQVVGGVRVENTLQKFETRVAETMDGKYGTIRYTDLLPSVNFNYIVSARTNIRLSYYKSLCRPGFFEVIPYSITGEDFTEVGNPWLDRTRAHNFDVRYEFYPGSVDQLLVGAFYKIIEDPIETTYKPDPGKATIFVMGPNNFGTAANYGLELVATKYFGPVGVSANYTFTASAITTDKLLYDKVPGSVDNQLTTVKQTRPLQGQSKHIANASLIYKGRRDGLTIQLSGVYTGRRIIQVSPYLDLDYWQEPLFSLDFSAEKAIGKFLVAFVKLGNLLDSPMRVNIDKPNALAGKLPLQTNADSYLVQSDRYGQSGQIGLRFKL